MPHSHHLSSARGRGRCIRRASSGVFQSRRQGTAFRPRRSSSCLAACASDASFSHRAHARSGLCPVRGVSVPRGLLFVPPVFCPFGFEFDVMPNHALQRTRRGRRGCNHCVPCAGSLSLGRSPDTEHAPHVRRCHQAVKAAMRSPRISEYSVMHECCRTSRSFSSSGSPAKIALPSMNAFSLVRLSSSSVFSSTTRC